MTKRKNTEPVQSGNKRPKPSEELRALRNEKFKLLQDKLQELNVPIQLTFITGIIGHSNAFQLHLQFMEFLLKQDNVSGQFEYVKLKILEENNIQLPSISSILNGAGKKASETFNSLFEKLFTKEGNIWIKSELLQALDHAEIPFTSLSSILQGARAKGAEAFVSLFEKLFTKQDNVWVKSELLQTLETQKIPLTTLSSILHRAGTKAPEAFISLFEKLFTKQDNVWVKSELLQTFEIERIYLPNISSILHGTGAKAAEIFDSLFNKLFTRQDNRWVKSELLQALENEEIYLANISSILSGAGAKAPEAFDLLCKKLFTRQDNKWVKSEQLQALNEAEIPLSRISSILSGAGAKASVAFDSLFNKLFTKQNNIWVKSEQLQALEEQKIPLTTMSGILHKAGAKAPEAFESLFQKLFTRRDNRWVKSDLLQALETSEIPLPSISNILHGAGAQSARAFDSFFSKLLILQDDNTWVKSVLLQAFDHAEISFSSISSILSGAGAKAPKAFTMLAKKLFTKRDNVWVKSEQLQTLETAEISFSSIAGILSGARNKGAEAFDSLFKKLFIKQGNILTITHKYKIGIKYLKYICMTRGILMANVQLSNTYELGDKWLEREFRHVNLGDKRLIARLIKTTTLLEGKASGSINQSCKSWREAKGAYRLLSNKKFNPEEIYSSHYKETGERIKGNKYVCSVQDTSNLDFDSHIKTKGLGSISKAYTKHKMGLMVHTALMLTMEGLPLGLSSQQCWARVLREETAQEKTRRKYISSIKEKESYKWITALQDTMNIIPVGTQVVTIGDREADIFELLWRCQELSTLFIVRNRQNRKFICPKIGKTNLQTRINQIREKEEMVLQIPKKQGQKSREAKIEIKYISGLIPISSPSLYGSKDTGHKISDKVAISVVRAKEIDPPEETEAIDWTLLTNIPVVNFKDAIERINCYKLRWKVEEYFRVLKSGCKIENSRLSTKDRLEKLIALKSIIAFKILYLSKAAISHPEELCTKILSLEEWQALYIREHKALIIPKDPPTIKQAIIWLGKLGGFMNRKSDKLPGTMTLWRGYENLKDSMDMLCLFIPQNCG